MLASIISTAKLAPRYAFGFWTDLYQNQEI